MPCDDLEDNQLKSIMIEKLHFLKNYLNTKNESKWKYKKIEISKELIPLAEIITDLAFDLIN
jgi:hypothetical protein